MNEVHWTFDQIPVCFLQVLFVGVYVYSSVYYDQIHVKERHEETISLGVLEIIRVKGLFFSSCLIRSTYMYIVYGWRYGFFAAFSWSVFGHAMNMHGHAMNMHDSCSSVLLLKFSLDIYTQLLQL